MTAARRGATPAMAPGQDGLLTPQLLVLEGGLGLPGLVRWVTAFTTGPADASLLHRAFFHAYIGPQGQPGPVEWRLESQGLGLAPPPPTRILQAEALSLGAALDAAVAAATRLATSAGQAAALGPAFVQCTTSPDCLGSGAAPGWSRLRAAPRTASAFSASASADRPRASTARWIARPDRPVTGTPRRWRRRRNRGGR